MKGQDVTARARGGWQVARSVRELEYTLAGRMGFEKEDGRVRERKENQGSWTEWKASGAEVEEAELNALQASGSHLPDMAHVREPDR